MADSPTSRVRKVAGSYLESPVDGELMVLNVATGTFNGLKDVGLAIWRALDETDDPAAISAMLGERYDVTPERCTQEVGAFLDTLIEAGLLAPA